MLEVDDLHVNYGNVEAVRGVSLSARPGRITLLLGPNGAGKSTTLKAVAGLLQPAAGRISLNGSDVTGSPAHTMVRHGLVLVPEGRRIFGPLSVLENLRLGAYKANRSAWDNNIARAFELFPILKDRQEMAAGLMSGGEQQMLAIARALMSEPRVILMDEPSMGLAPAMVEVVLDAARQVADSGLAIVMVEQNVDFAVALADDVLVMSTGEVRYSGASSDAQADAAIVRGFLGESASP